MKRLALILSIGALSFSAFCQGVVNFANSPTTLVSDIYNGFAAAISGPAGSYYFGLLIAQPGTTDPRAFTFTGIYATNSGVAAGRFVRNGVQVPGWQAGHSMSYEVAGWSVTLGAAFQPTWLLNLPPAPFALSAIGTGVAGGTDLNGNSLPPLPLFGGTGIASGFNLVIIPEPSGLTLAGLFAAALLVLRRRRQSGSARLR